MERLEKLRREDHALRAIKEKRWNEIEDHNPKVLLLISMFLSGVLAGMFLLGLIQLFVQ